MRYSTLLAAAAAIATSVASLASAQQIGVVSSLEPNMRATAPGQSVRSLSVGNGVVADDAVQTSDTARGQLMFVDETTLSVAPASQIVLDRFVYDPSGGDSGFAMKLTTGALRFVGGATSEAQEAVISTPTATLGIRGSSALVSFLGGQTIAVFLMGDQMCLTPNGGSRRCTSRYGAVLTEDGYAGQVSQEYLTSMLTRIDGPPPRTLVRSASDAGVGDTVSPRGPVVSTRGAVFGAGDANRFYLEDLSRGVLERGPRVRRRVLD